MPTDTYHYFGAPCLVVGLSSAAVGQWALAVAGLLGGVFPSPSGTDGRARRAGGAQEPAGVP